MYYILYIINFQLFHNLSFKMTRKIIFDQEVVINEYKLGKSMFHISKRLNIPYCRVIEVIKNNNIPRPSNKGKPFHEYQFDTMNIEQMLEDCDWSVHAVHKKYDIPSIFLNRLCEEQNLTHKLKYKRISKIGDGIKNAAINFYLSGNSFGEIYQMLNISERNLSNILKEKGISPEHRTKSMMPFYNALFEYTKKARRLSLVFRNNYNVPPTPPNMHWNHKFSIYDGFKNKVPLEIIASMANQELIAASENLKQGANSKITLNELRQAIIAYTWPTSSTN
jgi:hypothetical protein